MENNNGNPNAQSPSSASKRGVLIAALALAVVLVVGVFAYNTVVSTTGTRPEARTAQESSQTAGQGTASGTSQGNRRMLADYDAEVYTRDGTPVRMTDIADGKPLVVNFWATWCPYCIQEMGDFQKIYDDYGDRVSFAFVDCADGKRETVEAAAAWLQDNGYDLPDYYDTTQKCQLAFGASALPTTAVVAADGEIVAVSAGAIDPALMRGALEQLL